MSLKSLLLLTVAIYTCTAAEVPKTVFVVRHAERAGGMGDDVGISDAGRCRAGLLAGILADAGVKAIFTSEVARTQQTAEPLAKRLNLHPETVAAKDYDALAARLHALPDGATALVVGHSNTIPAIIQKLGGDAISPIADTEFDRLYVVTLLGKQASVVMLHYQGCAPTK